MIGTSQGETEIPLGLAEAVLPSYEERVVDLSSIL